MGPGEGNVLDNDGARRRKMPSALIVAKSLEGCQENLIAGLLQLGSPEHYDKFIFGDICVRKVGNRNLQG